MNNQQLVQFTINLHTKTMVGLIDAAMRADTPAQRNERLALARNAALDFKSETLPLMLSAFPDKGPA